MNHDAIATKIDTIRTLKAATVRRVHGNNGDTPRVEILGRYGDLLARAFLPDLEATEVFLQDRVDKRRVMVIAQLEAELKGEICPQPEPDPDAYLDPVREAFGTDEGLNANWSAMAWRIAGNMEDGTWLLDDESPEETVSLVTRKDDGSGDPAIVTICQGTVEQVLTIAEAIAAQVQHG